MDGVSGAHEEDLQQEETLVLLKPSNANFIKKSNKHKKKKKRRKKKRKRRMESDSESESESGDSKRIRQRRKRRKKRRLMSSDSSSSTTPSSHDDESKHEERSRPPERRPAIFQVRDIAKYCESHQVVVVLAERHSSSLSFLRRLAEEAWAGEAVCTESVPLRAKGIAFDLKCKAFVESFERQAINSLSSLVMFRDTMLVKEIANDPLLHRFSMVLIDDFQERSINTDFLVSLLTKIVVRRPLLRVVVFAADEPSAELAESRFKTCTSVALLDVRPADSPEASKSELFYLKYPTRDFVEEAVDLIEVLHMEKELEFGNFMVFLASEKHVLKCLEKLKSRSRVSNLNLFTWTLSNLTAELKIGRAAPGTRNCVLATSVVESHSPLSAAFHKLALVIDCVFTQRRVRDPSSGIEATETVPVSKEEAFQRGKFANKLVLRLCTETTFQSLVRGRIPEIERTGLTSSLLRLKTLQVSDIVHFDFICPPPSSLMIDALEKLHALKAIDDTGEIIPGKGQRMAEFLPLDPSHSCFLLESLKRGCSVEALTIVAMLVSIEEQHLFRRSAQVSACMRALGALEGDFVFYLNLYNAWVAVPSDKRAFLEHFGVNHKVLSRSQRVRKLLERQLSGYAAQDGLSLLSCFEDMEAISRCACAAFCIHAAQLGRDGKSLVSTKGGQVLEIHPSSVFHDYGRMLPGWIVCSKLQQPVRSAQAVKGNWLAEDSPHVFKMGPKWKK